MIKRTRTLSLPILLARIVSMACSSTTISPSGISLPYFRRTRNNTSPILFQGRVVGVQDGDTIDVVDSSNTNRRIRLKGIDAPEKGQAFGTQSKHNLSQAVFKLRFQPVLPRALDSLVEGNSATSATVIKKDLSDAPPMGQLQGAE